MQLDEFVRTTLVQIAKGVKEAQEDVTKLGGAVNPLAGSMYGSGKPEKEKIEFDVALVVQDTSSSELGGKLSVASCSGCSGQLNPDTLLSRFSASAGGIPSLC